MLFRNLLLAITILAAMHGRARSQDDPSQRLLPLPQRDLPDLQQQMELLKKLRSLIDSRHEQEPATVPRDSKSKPSMDPQQYEQLSRALKSLQDKLPPGFVPPDLSSIPPEQLKKVMEDPSVQQQMRDMLKQFSKDGVLPPPGHSGGNSPPLPARPPADHPSRPENRSPNRSQKAPNDTPPDSDSGNGDSGNGEASGPATLPPTSMQSLQDFMKKLADESTPNETPQNPSATQPPPPRPLRRKEYGTTPGRPRPNDAPQGLQVPERGVPQSEIPSSDEQVAPSRPPRTSQDPRKTNPGIPNPGTTNPRNTNPANGPSLDQSAETLRSDNVNAEAQQRAMKALQDLMEDMTRQGQQEPGSQQQPGSQHQPGVAPRSEFAPPVGTDAQSQQSIPPSLGEAQGNPPPDESPNPDPASSPGNRVLPGESPRQETGNSESADSRGKLPSVPDFLKEQLKKLNLSPDRNSSVPRTPQDRVAGSPQNPSRSNPSARPNQQAPQSSVTQPSAQGTQPPGQGTQPPGQGTQPRPERSLPPMDIQKELERNGFGGTLKKIVEKARQESRQPNPSGNDSSTRNGTASTKGKTSPGLEQSMIRILDGMKDDLAEIAKDGGFREPSRRPESQRQSPPPRRDPGPQSNSALNKMRKAASNLFSGPAKSPQRNNPSGGSSSSLSIPSLETQFDLTPVAVLAGFIMAVAVGFFGLRFLKLRTAAAASIGPAMAPIAPAEIQNRADLIRAFHEFALRSTKSVQSWWTHRAVERVIVTAAPEKKAAVETLANAYEQARYLPQDLELSSEQIQSARNALQQCAAGARV